MRWLVPKRHGYGVMIQICIRAPRRMSWYWFYSCIWM